MSCKHDWKIIAKTWAEPIPTGSKISGVSDATYGRLILGQTTIVWECQNCHNLRREEMLGKEVKNG